MAGILIKTMYKADIISTKINRGVLSVEVLFHNDEDTFTDTIETNQYQNDSWIGEQIERRLKHLNSLSLIKDNITIGSYQKTERGPKTEQEIYQEKTNLYLNYMNTARMGIIPYDRPIIAELKEWLRDNFKDEYLNIV